MKALPVSTSPINFNTKATGERNAGSPHVAFEVAGAGNGMMEDSQRARNRKRGNKPRVDLHITAPVFYSAGKFRVADVLR